MVIIVTVNRKGQITIPASLRKKLGIRDGTKICLEEIRKGFVLKIDPRLQELTGVDAGKMTVKKAFAIIDKMRSQDRY
jgi:AbrB family looped-hinge helix DNA binding protein